MPSQARSLLARLLLLVVTLAVAAFVVLMATKTYPYLSFEKGIYFLTTKSEETNDIPIFRLGFYVHITTSLVVLVVGLLQFLPLVAARSGSTLPAKTNPPASAPTEGTAALAKFNLAPLWRMRSGSSDDKVHNGFFGYGYRRLELVFTSVQRDEKNPSLYHVQGKDRRYNIVRSFSGTLTFNRLRKASANEAPGLSDYLGQPYAASGEFVLREKARPGDEAYGTFRGKLAADLLRTDNAACS